MRVSHLLDDNYSFRLKLHLFLHFATIAWSFAHDFYVCANFVREKTLSVLFAADISPRFRFAIKPVECLFIYPLCRLCRGRLREFVPLKKT